MENVFNVGNRIVFYVEDMVIYLLTLLILLSAIFCIRAKYPKSQNQILIFKPLTIILIIFIAVFFPAVDIRYKIFIVLGLLFSLIGDFLLIYPENHFKNGLITFLIGHIFYIVAFTVSTGFHLTYWIMFPIAIAGIIFYKQILPYTGKLKIPVAIYVIILAVMGWVAMERFNYIPTTGTLFAAIGAGLFVISDATLAYNKFKKSFHFAEMIILSTYFTAQWFLAVSVIVE